MHRAYLPLLPVAVAGGGEHLRCRKCNRIENVQYSLLTRVQKSQVLGLDSVDRYCSAHKGNNQCPISSTDSTLQVNTLFSPLILSLSFFSLLPCCLHTYSTYTLVLTRPSRVPTRFQLHSHGPALPHHHPHSSLTITTHITCIYKPLSFHYQNPPFLPLLSISTHHLRRQLHLSRAQFL